MGVNQCQVRVCLARGARCVLSFSFAAGLLGVSCMNGLVCNERSFGVSVGVPFRCHHKPLCLSEPNNEIADVLELSLILYLLSCFKQIPPTFV